MSLKFCKLVRSNMTSFYAISTKWKSIKQCVQFVFEWFLGWQFFFSFPSPPFSFCLIYILGGRCCLKKYHEVSQKVFWRSWFMCINFWQKDVLNQFLNYFKKFTLVPLHVLSNVEFWINCNTWLSIAPLPVNIKSSY